MPRPARGGGVAAPGAHGSAGAGVGHESSHPAPPADVSKSLSPAQRKLLELFRRDLPEETWEDLQDVISQFFAERAIREADRVWDEKGWTDADADRMLHAHYRRPSKAGVSG